MKISAVIPTNRKRKEELSYIKSYLESFFNEVIIQKDVGHKIYTRYEGIKKAKNEIIYTQDDDCLIYNINTLIDHYEENIITANATEQSKNKYMNTGICLIGYGAIFDRYLIGKLEDFRVKMDVGDLFFRECDRIFTALNTTKLIRSNIKNFPSAFTGISNDKKHEEYLKKIKSKINEYKNLYSNNRW